ncbi:MAG: hypothetical protein PUB19_08560 [Lachnospiraceae bacterium]|nr:hypothetical protein [Lachnospiraceae bacterium]
MNKLRNQRYSFEQAYYLPERVFFLNLLQYCECDHKIILERITTRIRREIDAHVNHILGNIQHIEDKFPDAITTDPEHLLPDDFLKFVKDHCGNRTDKRGHYLLWQCYQRTHTVVSWVDNLYDIIDDKKSRPQCIDEDRQLLRSYQDWVRDLSAVSLRGSFRINVATGIPVSKKSPQIKSFSPNQNNVIRFAMEKVFPDLIIRSERPLLSSFIAKSWHDVVCKSSLKNGVSSTVIIIDSCKENGFVKDMQSRFDLLREIASHQCPEDETQHFGEILLGIYDRLSDYHKNGVIYGLEANYIPEQYSDFENQESSIPVDDKAYEWDSLIATHIINYLKWVNSTYDNTPDFMESIDRVIDKIRPQVLYQIGTTITLEEFRKLEKEGCDKNSLFLWPCCTHLSSPLFKALFAENIIFMKGH